MIVLTLIVCLAGACTDREVILPRDVTLMQCITGAAEVQATVHQMRIDGTISRDAVLKRWRCGVRHG